MGKFVTLRRAKLRARAEGQSIPLIALMIVVLIGMVALSVDAGNTYAEQRKLVAATDAAAIVGLQKYLEPGSKTDGDVLKAIEESFKVNDINVTDGYNKRNFTAVYLDSLGREIPGIVGSRGSAAPPTDVTYIQIKSDGKVDTFFARVLGRPDLPVRYAAYAGTCPPNAGIYPIAVDGNLFTTDQSRFDDPGTANEYGTMPSDRNGSHWGSESVTWRRVYVRDPGISGGFGWLRWSDQKDPNGYGAQSENALQASLTGPGNAVVKFEEMVPSPIPAESPAGYPIQPGTPNPGDWVYQGPGKKNSNDIRYLLDGHKYVKNLQPGTLMTLPIFDKTTAGSQGGSNGGYRIARFGTFVLKDYDMTGNEPYLDLIYLPTPPRNIACTVTPPAPTALSLRGEVSFMPVWQEETDEIKPVHYLVVLDVSGSMNFSFKGYGRKPSTGNPGTPAWCDGDRSDYNFGDKIPNVTLDDGTVATVEVVKCNASNGENYPYAWNPIEQRRIYVAKEALEHLVSLANMPKNTGYTTSRPSDEMMVIWFDSEQQSSWKTNWLNNPATLKTAIKNAGTANNNAYLTSGGTNGAAGLYRANDQLSKKSATTNYNGTNWEFKQVIVYVTDGVSNNFLDTGKSNLSGGGNNDEDYFYLTDSLCADMGGKIPAIPSCHLSSDEGAVKVKNGKGSSCTAPEAGGFTSSCYDRPITQMIKQGDILRSNEIEVHVIGLSDFDKTGLDLVAGSSANLHKIRQVETYGDGRTNVDIMMEYINRRIKDPDCQVGVDTEVKNTMTQGEAATQYYAWRRVGTVTLRDTNGNTLSTPINVGDDGKLTYEFRDLPEGTYTLTAFIYYIDSRDVTGKPLLYGQLQVGERLFNEITVPVSFSPEYTGGKNLLLRADNSGMCAPDE